MQFSPFTLHAPDWHTLAAVPDVHPPGDVPPPAYVPHFPFEPQTLATHSFAAVQLVVVLGPAHVLVLALHCPEAQVVAAFALEQVPSWRPSFGIATPFALSSTHVSVFRLQCFAVGQSLST